MANSHARSVRNAGATVARLKELFDRMGTIDVPGGFVQRAYRQARRELAAVDIDNLRAVQNILDDWQGAIADGVPDLLGKSWQTGASQAVEDLRAYGTRARLADGAARLGAAENAIAAAAGAQAARVMALSMLGDVGAIIGDEARVGVFSVSVLTNDLARWITALAGAAWSGTVSQSAGKTEFRKQAVAAIDERTTECCLLVHGQTQPLDGLFQLAGEPRYADELDGPPFHRYCRTAQALVPAEATNDELTNTMRDAANTELDAREAALVNNRKEIHPAHATSRRG
jgi:hypothetical protein